MAQYFRQEQSFIFSQMMAQRLSILQMSAAKLSLLIEKAARENPLLDASKIPAPWNRSTASVDSSIAESVQQERRLYDQVKEDLLLEWEEDDADLLYLIIGSLDAYGFLGMDGRELCQGTLFDGERTEFLRLKILGGSLPGLAAIGAKEYYVYAAREFYGEGSPAHRCALTLASEKNKIDAGGLAAQLNQSTAWVKDALDQLKKLPSSPLGPEAQAIIPDFLVKAEGGKLSIFPTRSLKPGVLIPAEGEYSPAQLQAFRKEAQSLLEAVQAREEALFRHAEALILARSDFFIKDSPPSVVRLREISAITGRHMSTVSRALKGRTFIFDGAITPFAALWSRNVGGKSHRLLEEGIKNILENEDTSQPLSDEDIQRVLEKRGIKLARRTVAKYREKMGIPGMHERKNKQGGK